MLGTRANAVIALAAAWLGTGGVLIPATAAGPTPQVRDAANARLAHSISVLIRDAIPVAYERQKDWGATKEIAVGLRTEGKGLNVKLHRRKKPVNHGVWKHYKIRLVEPEKNLAVQLTNLRPLAPGRMGFTLQLDAKLDAWVRAKVYQLGVHLVALEVEGDTRVTLQIEGEIGLEATMRDGLPGMAVRPQVTAARLTLNEFHLRRVSNARGPLVRELGDEIGKLVEDEINGPPLVDKLNRAIDKKRDRLVFSASELVKSDWRPLVDQR